LDIQELATVDGGVGYAAMIMATPKGGEERYR
jgi:hypothetical protein